MKLMCETCIVNRAQAAGKRPFQKSVLAIGKNSDKKSDESVIVVITNANKNGTRFKIVKNISKIFTRFLNEGKATISFQIPEMDLQLKGDAIQLKGFLQILKNVLTGSSSSNEANGENKTVKLPLLNIGNKKSSLLQSAKVQSTKCVVRSRGDYPTKGFSRTLTHLEISEINLCRVDGQVMLLKNLKILNLSHNLIEKIPKQLGTLTLCDLDLSANHLQNADWSFLLEPNIQNNLQNLNISNNNLSYFPVNLVNAKKLITLKIEENHISKLPFAIWRMSSLKFLLMANNRIGSVPEPIRLMRLDTLDLSGNNFVQDYSVPDVRMQNTVVPVNALWEIAGRVIIKNKIPFSRQTIPGTLVDILNRTPICACGVLCYSSKIFEKFKTLRLSINNLILNAGQMIYADCVFCSQKCISK